MHHEHAARRDSPRIERRHVPPHPDLPEELHPVLRRVYAARGALAPDAVSTALTGLAPVDMLDGTARAAAILADAVVQDRSVLVVGDFDADGATSATLAVSAMRALGARRVDYLVPNRFEYGYGLTPEIVALAATRGPDILVTVDNGISSHAGAEAARAHGMQLVITDHHLPAATLPVADAIVNPVLPGQGFPSRALAGVGVIFYVISALRNELKARSSAAQPRLSDWLDLVALGTVADVVALDRNNRILVAQGVRRIRAGRARPGIMALAAVAGRDYRELTAADLGYAIAPRLNAAGRLEDMSIGIECLLAEDEARARELAQELDRLNRDRRDIEQDMHRQALDLVARMRLDEARDLPAGLCLFEPDWHQGVIGIVAGRVKERLHRPVIAFARSGQNELKGSARSIEGFHVRDALDMVAARNPGMLSRFGGHAMAAGLTLEETAYAPFAAAFDRVAREQLGETGAVRKLLTDGELDADDLSLSLAEELRTAGPWGQAFPEPVFEGVFEVRSQRVVGGRHLKLQVSPQGSPHGFDAIAFNPADDLLQGSLERVYMAYRLDVNVWRGMRSVQLVAEHLESA